MAKRFYYPQQNGERKKAKLDITVSDHNFPLSQNIETRRDDQVNNWGDDNDDEILLLASQACEQAFSTNFKTLPDYSICMQPSSTSTQIYDPGPSTSKAFIFKEPTTSALNTISTNLKNKCERISSPLPGISKVIQKPTVEINLGEDMIFNDKICKGDSDYVYRQLLQLQEENSKLKSENGKLLEKCVTKEGEVSILRTQLKTSQVAADNARLDKIKVQEKVQMEWNDKFATINAQLQDLRTQLDFKNLEITSIKEKCKMLESSKVKLTQVTVPRNDISSSYKHNDSKLTQARRLNVVTTSVQTENKSHLLKLNRTYRSEQQKLNQILPLTMESSTDHCTILEYNEKLLKPKETASGRCKVFSTFHRIPNTPIPNKIVNSNKVSLSQVYEDLAFIAAGSEMEKMEQKIVNVFKATETVLKEVQSQLEMILRRMTSAFEKEMDEKYIEATSNYLVVVDEDLICGRALYKEEQAILARRMTAVLYYVLEYSQAVDVLNCESKHAQQKTAFVELINEICVLLDSTSCALLYSGFLLSVTKLIDRMLTNFKTPRMKIFQIVKTVIESRPSLTVSCEMLLILRKLSSVEDDREIRFCCGRSGNLKCDYDQGVLLYKKDTCFLQVLYKQIEAALKCIERQNLEIEAYKTTRNVLLFYATLNQETCDVNDEKQRCDCKKMSLQVVVYALRICAVMLNNSNRRSPDARPELLSVCRSGIQVLYKCSLRDVEYASQLAYNEGHLLEFCEILRLYEHAEIYSNMLSELMTTFQPLPDDSPSSFNRDPWLKSFQNFTVTD